MPRTGSFISRRVYISLCVQIAVLLLSMKTLTAECHYCLYIFVFDQYSDQFQCEICGAIKSIEEPDLEYMSIKAIFLDQIAFILSLLLTCLSPILLSIEYININKLKENVSRNSHKSTIYYICGQALWEISGQLHRSSPKKKKIVLT